MSHPHPTPQQSRILGARLRAARSELGWSQEKVALQAGISLQHLSLLERGLSNGRTKSPANPRLGVLLNLAKALTIDIGHLIEPLRIDYSGSQAEEGHRSSSPEHPQGT
ncbi:helix-turn-helix domain-containing protein [Nesterenkonia ebinurensis]|uniref:helix-turn-helix domain-containing protein n=1 Tax=Nesterenkonia ebinurensis TaxID=2608252 RepID=UPI00168B2A54|nr:helix-turn-helix transcriptional regulator [Nesterenkonia ebinurensis]